MNLWVAIEELRNAVGLTQLTAAQSDDKLISYCLAAQRFAESYCKRYFDGTVPKTQYFSTRESPRKLVVKNYPILSVTTLKVDSSLAFAASSAISSSDYLIQSELGMIKKISGTWADPYGLTTSVPDGEDDIQLISLGGYIPEQTLVAEATPASSHTIVAQTNFYSQAFQLWVTSRVANAAGNVTLTGTDESGNAQTETITFAASTASVTGYRKASKLSWKSLTAVNSSGINTSGALVKVVASSMQDVLRQALALHTAHLYDQASSRSVNVTGRNVESDSESGFVHEIPKEVMQLLGAYRNFQ